jgi:hypothetical protein
LVTLHVADLPIRIIGGALETSSHRFSTREIGHENDFQISQLLPAHIHYFRNHVVWLCKADRTLSNRHSSLEIGLTMTNGWQPWIDMRREINSFVRAALNNGATNVFATRNVVAS